MSAESVLYSTLKNDSGVSAIVGTGDAAKIYPDQVPEDQDPPAIGFSRMDTEYVETIHESSSLGRFVSFAVVCIDTTRAGAEALANAVVLALGAAGMNITNRQPDNDPENGLYVSIVTVVYFEQ